MPGPKERDLELTRARLTEWLAERMPDARELRIGELTGLSTTGFSNDTLLFDLAWQEAAEHRSAGLVALYQEKSGLTVRHFHYYEVFAAGRFGVVMMRIGQQLNHYGLIPDESDFEVNNIVTRLLAKLLESDER